MFWLVVVRYGVPYCSFFFESFFISYILRFAMWSIVLVSDWTNDVFSQSFASDLCQSLRKHLSMYKIKTSYRGKCLNDFYSLVSMHRETHSFAALTCLFFFIIIHRNSWIKIVRAHFPSDNLQITSVIIA